MRFIHTADWHLGQTINGWTREAEHRAFLEILPEIVAKRRADALVVAGDVFDGVNPANETMAMYYEALIRLHRRNPALTTVIVAGNHDSAGRLQAPRDLLRLVNVHVVSTVHRAGGGPDLDRHLVPIPGADGSPAAFVLAVPFLRPVDLPGLAADTEETGSPVVRATRRLYADLVAAARRRIGPAPLIATGHLHCQGGEESEGSERPIIVGGEHAVPADVFPADLAYVALGHLHKAQSVGRATVRYSGSILPLSASELSYRHSLTVVDVEAGGTRVEEVVLPRAVPCIRLPETGTLRLGNLEAAVEALGLDPDRPTDLRPLVHVVLAAEGPAGLLVAEAERLLADRPLRSAGIRVERPATAAVAPRPVVRLADTQPADLFLRAFEARHGAPPSEAHREAFRQLLSAE